MACEFSFTEELLKEVAKWGVPIAGGLVAVFFSPLIDNIKLRLNRADIRAKQFEEFATDLSCFIYYAKVINYVQKEGLTDPTPLNALTESYNEAILALRKKEYVYRSWAERYWSKVDYPRFKAVMAAIDGVDRAMLVFNDGRLTEDRIVNLQKNNDALVSAANSLLAPRW
jgi:hypothetical protein